MNTYTKFKHIILSGTLFVFLISVLCSSVQAQEFLTGSRINPQVFNKPQQRGDISGNPKTETQPLLLPFFEDFSNYTGYPNENLFIDRQAFVNSTFPVFPPSIGVVTLDALNEYGEIYPHLNTVPKGADTLTSQYIRLDSVFVDATGREITLADSIYFSFYFQPGGAGIANAGPGERIGNQPDNGDSLVLEFRYFRPGDTVTNWKHVWSTPGFNANIWIEENPYQYFKQVMIPITDENYLRDNFQFRFRNYASLEPQQGITGWEGNVDQWHIDYIRLDVNRTRNDVFTNDLAFVTPTTSFLQNYQAMPWKQFRSSTDMKSNFTNHLTNLSEGMRTSKYQYTITQKNNIVAEYVSGSIDIAPYATHGLHSYPSQASPDISLKPNLTDTATFTVTHVFQNAAGVDIYPQNDTCVFVQKFYNYYAYDDGTAEYGYCLNNQFNIASLAMKFSLRVPDTLSAVRMWFNQTKNHENENASFSIIVWEDNNGEPGKEIYTMEENKPEFANEFLNFVEYKLDKKLLVSGDIWIGFKQQGNLQLNIGFDQNNDSRNFFKYNTNGTWSISAFKGTPMLRPVFGELEILNLFDHYDQTTNTVIAPNPTSNSFQISNYKFQITKVEVFTVAGMKIDEKQCRDNYVQMNVANYPAGIYLVRVYKENSAPEIFKLIKK
ncbi:MAG: T9SS type A sorting domain-containing protein [Bacteroidetes bacterium]|nr:T9SS type A sorting domain-containing protein [Bacteroidota bacterium]MCL1968260.1 T9SS type A sorting domain-containing protein [Bacteroidota bacterium]